MQKKLVMASSCTSHMDVTFDHNLTSINYLHNVQLSSTVWIIQAGKQQINLLKKSSVSL